MNTVIWLLTVRESKIKVATRFVEPYNIVLSERSFLEHTDITVMLDRGLERFQNASDPLG